VRQEKLKAFNRATRLEKGSWGLKIKLYILDRWMVDISAPFHGVYYMECGGYIWLDVEGMLMKGLVRL
jgi:hypothetical protein